MTRSVGGGKLHATRNLVKFRVRAKASVTVAGRKRKPLQSAKPRRK